MASSVTEFEIPVTAVASSLAAVATEVTGAVSSLTAFATQVRGIAAEISAKPSPLFLRIMVRNQKGPKAVYSMTPEEVRMSSLRRSRPLLLILFVLFILLGGLPHQAFAQPAAQVADINTARTGGTDLWFWRTSFYAVNGTVLFQVDDGKHGMELWRTDGTAAGTSLPGPLRHGHSVPGGRRHARSSPAAACSSMPVTASMAPVQDIRPGTGSGSPSMLTAAGGIGGMAFFSAETDATGRELWKTDGTAAGTVLVKDIQPGPGSGADFLYDNDDVDLGERWAALGNKVVFQADEGLVGQEPWVSDGTPAGTIRLADIVPGSQSSEPRWITTAAGRVFFVADGGVSGHGRELWTTDGTPAGTSLLIDIEPGAGSSLPGELRAIGRVLLFSAWDAVHGRELWVSDGTTAGTTRVQDIAPGELSAEPWPPTPAPAPSPGTARWPPAPP